MSMFSVKHLQEFLNGLSILYIGWCCCHADASASLQQNFRGVQPENLSSLYKVCAAKGSEIRHVVFDIYLENSLKSATRAKRGSGKRLRVVGNTIIPRNWQEFLRVNDNETELFHFLAEGLVGGLGYNEKKTLVTYDDHVQCVSEQLDVDSIDPCNHEEIDMCFILHCYRAAENGS